MVDEKNDRMLAFDYSGYVRVLEVDTATKDVATDIDWEVQSKDFTLQTRAHFPRWAKYDIETGGGCTDAKAEILLDDTIHQTHLVIQSSVKVASYDRSTRRRLIDIGNGERCSIKLSGTGPTTIYAAEME